jgi:hypothetical protein
MTVNYIELLLGVAITIIASVILLYFGIIYPELHRSCHTLRGYTTHHKPKYTPHVTVKKMKPSYIIKRIKPKPHYELHYKTRVDFMLLDGTKLGTSKVEHVE